MVNVRVDVDPDDVAIDVGEKAAVMDGAVVG
ncbi:hypothetical protein FHR88_001168 [Bradyrhizobium betae]|nr:hypothetical protein [Bradyrhizobium betae]